MTFVSNKISENLAMLVLASFMFVAIFGVGMSMEMEDGQMSSCPFMANQVSICQMSVTEHINQWQSAFLSIPAKSNVLLLALLLLALAITPLVKPFSQIKQSETVTNLRSYLRDTASKIFNPLLLAFSDGILNPKIYEPSRI